MSNFYCDKCGKAIIDSPRGYITGCIHYPLTAWMRIYIETLEQGKTHGEARAAADEYCRQEAE